MGDGLEKELAMEAEGPVKKSRQEMMMAWTEMVAAKK